MNENRRSRRVLFLGAASALLSAGATYYYVLPGLVLYPVFVVLFLFARSSYRAPRSRRPGSRLGFALAVAALLMPIASGASWWVFNWTQRTFRPNGALIGGEPFFYAVYTPAVVALIACIAVAVVRTMTSGEIRIRIVRSEPQEERS